MSNPQLSVSQLMKKHGLEEDIQTKAMVLSLLSTAKVIYGETFDPTKSFEEFLGREPQKQINFLQEKMYKISCEMYDHSKEKFSEIVIDRLSESKDSTMDYASKVVNSSGVIIDPFQRVINQKNVIEQHSSDMVNLSREVEKWRVEIATMAANPRTSSDEKLKSALSDSKNAFQSLMNEPTKFGSTVGQAISDFHGRLQMQSDNNVQQIMPHATYGL